jgi:hypothetical protein
MPSAAAPSRNREVGGAEAVGERDEARGEAEVGRGLGAAGASVQRVPLAERELRDRGRVLAAGEGTA